jgi:hypothetical protein
VSYARNYLLFNYLFIYLVHIGMNLTEIGPEGVNWIHLAQNRDHWRALVNTVMNVFKLLRNISIP